jgi:F-type H+-transporting ATPase subunit a
MPGNPAGAPTESGQAEGKHAEGAHAEGGEKKEEHGTSIENPSWITGFLKKIWFAGPATLTADGAVDASGNPIDPATLKGKAVDYKFEDEEAVGDGEKPHYDIHPVIGEVGKNKPNPSSHLQPVTVDGQQVSLIQPKVAFKLQSMFPELLVISLLTALGIAIFSVALTRNPQRIPGKRQAFVELIYVKLDAFVAELIPGDAYKRYVPLVATIFIYVLIMNLVGLIPGWKSPTANINVTAGMAIVVMVYVQYEGIRVNGFGGYLRHFMGDPLWLAPLNFPLHIIGEVARVLSLSVRLFGNIFGEDVVLAILIILAGMFTKGLVPFQAPMYLLALFTSFVQAMVFSILASVYLALMTTHEDHGHGHGEHGHDDHAHEDHAHDNAIEMAPAH